MFLPGFIPSARLCVHFVATSNMFIIPCSSHRESTSVSKFLCMFVSFNKVTNPQTSILESKSWHSGCFELCVLLAMLEVDKNWQIVKTSGFPARVDSQ